MKKMFLAIALTCVAALTQAGSVTWGTVAMFDASGSGSKVGSSAKGYLYLLTAEEYSSLDVWATYGDDVKNNAGSLAFNPDGKKSSTSKVKISTTADANTDYYGALVVTIGTGADMMYYVEKAHVTTGDDGNGTAGFGEGTLSTAAAAASAWKSATAPVTPSGPGGTDPIPEPTSGLLLMVGGALLALRRKQK